jgi:hypothetical protein
MKNKRFSMDDGNRMNERYHKAKMQKWRLKNPKY